jgi:hypothetical protein
MQCPLPPGLLSLDDRSIAIRKTDPSTPSPDQSSASWLNIPHPKTEVVNAAAAQQASQYDPGPMLALHNPVSA